MKGYKEVFYTISTTGGKTIILVSTGNSTSDVESCEVNNDPQSDEWGNMIREGLERL